MAELVTITADGFRTTQRDIERYGRSLTTVWAQRTRVLAERAAAIVREEAPYDEENTDGPHLRDDIVLQRFSAYQGQLDAVIATRSPRASQIATFVLRGTRPHVILPRRVGGRLAFTIGGRRVFARRVNHPGTRPNPFDVRARERIADEIEPELRTMVLRATAR